MATFVTSWDALGTGNGITPTEAGGLAQNDVITALFTCAGTQTPSLPSGWTQLLSGTVGTTADFKYVLGRVVRGASAPSYAFTMTGSAFRQVTLWAIRDQDRVTFENDIESTVGAGLNPNPPLATGGEVGGIAVALGVNYSGANPWGLPAGFTRLGNAGNSDIGAGYKAITVAGNEDPASFSGPASNDWVAITILHKPAGGTTPVVAQFTAPYEALAARVAAHVSPWDAVSTRAAVGSAPFEALAAAAATRAATYEALAAQAAAAIAPYEAPGGQGAAIALPFEALVGGFAALSVPYEALHAIAADLWLPWESAGVVVTPVVTTFALPWEANQATTAMLELPFEALAAQIAASTASFEASRAVAAPTAVPWETLVSAAAALDLPWETLGNALPLRLSAVRTDRATVTATRADRPDVSIQTGDRRR